MSRLCTICARGGSKGVKNKNIRDLHGKPLIAYTILQAKESNLFDLIAVSSDSDEILRTAELWGADLTIKRPDELATDQAAKLPVIKHCVTEAQFRTKKSFDVIVDLDATSPLRTVTDIIDAISMLEKENVDNIITGCPSRKSPYFNLVEVNDAGVVSLSKKLDKAVVRRQDAPKCYDMNASIYVWTFEALFKNESLFTDKTRLYEMPEDRSIDIDTEFDFEIVELLMKKRM